MVTLKHLLVATDFSETSDAALAYARELARAFGSTLHVLHVAGSVLDAAVGTDMYTADFVGMQKDVDEAAQKQLDSVLTAEDRRTLSAKAVVRASNIPAQTIVAYAKEAGIDLIVLGTHGRGGMAHLLLGSVAERVVRTAPCPVLTVREGVALNAPPSVEHVVAHA